MTLVSGLLLLAVLLGSPSLAATGLRELEPFPDFAFAGAPRVTVATATLEVSSETLVDTARQWLLNHLGIDPAQTIIHPLSVPSPLLLPRGELSLRVQPRGGPIQDGPVPVVVEVAVIDAKGQRTVRYATVSLQLERIRQVVVATRPLARKSVIRPSDVRILRRPGSRVPHGALTDLRQAVGKELVQEVRAGDVLAARSVKVPIVVRRGTPVVLHIDGPGFRITARGIAMQNGGIGQMIRVINQSSRKVLYGRIEGNGSVRIPF